MDLDGNKVYLALAKDGKEVDSKVVTPSGMPQIDSSNYMYKVDIGSEKDVPIIAAHIQSVFRSTEADLATVDGHLPGIRYRRVGGGGRDPRQDEGGEPG